MYWHITCILPYLVVCSRVILVFGRMYSYVLVCYSYVLVVTRIYSYVTRMYSYVTRIYSYVTRMYSYVTRMYSCFSHDRFKIDTVLIPSNLSSL